MQAVGPGVTDLSEGDRVASSFDYIDVSASLEDRMLEYVQGLEEHFLEQMRMKAARNMPPPVPGYSITMRPKSLDRYEYPSGEARQER